jgi:hypothetical protein
VSNIKVTVVVPQNAVEAFKERIDMPECVTDEEFATALVRIILNRYLSPARFSKEDLTIIADDIRYEKENNA